MAEEREPVEGQMAFPQAPDEGGERRPRVDGYERASGSAVFPSDLVLPGMVHGAILGCPHPNARVKSVDTSKAEAMPGVYAVISRNTPDANPAWSYGGDHDGRLFEDHCRFEGEAVAAVAADTPYHAADALRAIAVEYEELPFVSHAEAALEEGAPEVHPGGNTVTESSDARGDVEQGFGQADVVL